MRTRTYSKTFQGISSKDIWRIWRIWTDVNSWPTWHGDLDYCKLEGDFNDYPMVIS